MQAPPKLTTHLVQLEMAIHDISLGQISIQEFVGLLDRLHSRFASKLAEVRSFDIPADFAPEIAPEIEVGTQGIELYLQALELLRSYVDTRDLHALTRGAELARHANDLVNEAMRLNWATYETYRQTAEEFLAQQGRV